MDDVTGPPSEAWSTPVVAVAAAGALAVAAVVLAVLTPDAAGRLLLSLAAFGLGVAATLGALVRPRLRADADGLQVRRALGVTALTWDELGEASVVRTRRLGRDVPVLEIDGTGVDGVLLVLTRLDLGAEPDDVLTRLHQLHPPRTPVRE